MDMGRETFRYRIAPRRGNGDAYRRAEELNCPMYAMAFGFHDGELPERASLIDTGREELLVTAIKQARKGDELLVRLLETDGKEGTARIRLFDKDVAVSYTPYSLHTVSENGTELNLLEEPV